MTNDEHISEITGAFLEALKAAAQDLAGEYMKRLRAELQPALPGRDYAPVLRDGAALLRSTGEQSDTLEALLDAAAKVTPACGLLVLHGTLANGWNCRGITSTSTFKRAILDCSRGIAAHVVATGAAAESPVSELDPALVSRLGLYGKSRVALVPILLRDRPAALLLALLPMGDELPALEVLAQFARMTLELQLIRAATQTAGAVHSVAEPPAAAVAPDSAEAAPAMEPAAEVAEVPAPEVMTVQPEPAEEPLPEHVAETVAEAAQPQDETAQETAVSTIEVPAAEPEAVHVAAAEPPTAPTDELPPSEVSESVEEDVAPQPGGECLGFPSYEEQDAFEAGNAAPADEAQGHEVATPELPPEISVEELPQYHAEAHSEEPAAPEALPEPETVAAEAAATVAEAAEVSESAQEIEVAAVPEPPAVSTPPASPEPETIRVHDTPATVDEATVAPAPLPEEPHHPAAIEPWRAPEPPAYVPPAPPVTHPAPVYPITPHGYPPAYPAAGFVTTSQPTEAPAPPYHAPYQPSYGAPYGMAPVAHPVPPSHLAPAPGATGYAPPAAMPDPAHEKARRFAKLLVEEIKLYNQSKVAEGRARGDLYQRLREDIEKSRAAYRKRYGQTISDVDYFSQELLRILADNNPSLMGAGFPG